MKKNIIRLPYGISDFKKLVEQNFYYVDKTKYIEILEENETEYILFIRPRRFGKSLFVSVLDYYYNLKYKKEFNKLFGKFYIGKNPTPLRNSYMVLRFNFSGINTDNEEKTFYGFLSTVRTYVFKFLNMYQQILKLSEKQKNKIIDLKESAEIIKSLFNIVSEKTNKKIYVLIDEYDHFANELLSFKYDLFKKTVTENGFVRKFYETIKIATESIVDKIFITGVTPITLDSLTSGFNIKTNLSLEKELNEIMGFTYEETKYLIKEKIKQIPKEVLIKKYELKIKGEKKIREIVVNKIFEDLKYYYDGYLFNKKAENRIFNSDMVLYFLLKFDYENCNYPEKMLDTNIASDYNKIKQLFNIKNSDKNSEVLNELITNGFVVSNIVDEFALEKRFNENDLMSLLFYTGIVSIKGVKKQRIKFEIPNYVIKQLYFHYFIDIQAEKNNYQIDISDIENAIYYMGSEGNIKLLVEQVELLLKKLARKDYVKFDEKYIKIIFFSYLMLSNAYYVYSELEDENGFKDITCLGKNIFDIDQHFIIEIKYLKRSEKRKKTYKTILAKKLREAKSQLKKYEIKRDYKGKVHKVALIFCGSKCEKIIKCHPSPLSPF